MSTTNIATSTTDFCSSGDVLSSSNTGNQNIVNRDFTRVCHEAHILQTEHKYSDALHQYRDALLVMMKSVQMDESSLKVVTAGIFFEIGIIHAEIEDYERAVEAFGCCLDLRRACLPWNDPGIVSTLKQMAKIHYILKDSDKAIDLLLEAIAALEENAGPVELKETWQMLGEAQLQAGLLCEAESSFCEADLYSLSS